ncbi:hypothetical protein PC116_g25651 [Phytophthora cactorum]|nr:hypothetical protein PC116_g25651 [Phytophthora cactorum]
MRESLVTLGILKSPVLAWSSELQAKVSQKELTEDEEDPGKFSKVEKLISHQNCIIGELTAMNRALTDRASELEHQCVTIQNGEHSRSPAPRVAIQPSPEDDASKPKSCDIKAFPRSPAAVWF